MLESQLALICIAIISGLYGHIAIRSRKAYGQANMVAGIISFSVAAIMIFTAIIINQ